MTKSIFSFKAVFLSSFFIALGFCQEANAQFVPVGGDIINNNSNGKVIIGQNSNLSFNSGSDMLVGPNRFAFRYEAGGNVTNYGLRFSQTDGEYQFTDGAGMTLLGINATTGNTLMNGSLSFGATADYLVGPDRYAFRYQSGGGTVTDFGLLFNATEGQYQFLDNNGSSIVGIDAGTGETWITGKLNTTSARISDLAATDDVYEMVVADDLGNLSTQLIPAGGGADTDWTEDADGIYHNTGNVAINTTAIDTKSNLYVYRASGETGADSSGIYSYRSGLSGFGNGGVDWSEDGIDVAIKGTSNWGNEYSAGIAGFSYLDYANSAAVIGSQWSGGVQGALGFRDSEQVWAGHFNGDVRMMPERPNVINAGSTADLHLDIKRTYIDLIEFGHQHALHVLPTSKGLVSSESTAFYLGSETDYWSTIYTKSINPNGILSIHGETRITSGDLLVGSDIAINTFNPQNSLHIKQTNANSSLRIEDQSNADYWENGIGLTTQNYKFYFNGVIKADITDEDGAYVQSSDRKLKTDIEQLDNVLDKVMELKPSKYYYKESKARAKNKSYGFIAQEVQEIFPDIVRHNEDDSNLALAYDDFGILAIKAIQEQQTTIENVEKQNEALKAENEALRNDIAEIKNMLANLDSKVSSKTENMILEGDKAATLAQNSPNPFTNDTFIEYYIPENVNAAQLQITNLNGQVISTMDIATRGNTKTTISAKKLTAGTYLYSIVLDGKTIDTKQMILVK
ncbi:MAG: tail fiber domain-containing protein [Chitinophagales bacterium]